MLAGELGKLPQQNFHRRTHRCQALSKSRDYCNWELSADRANAARRLMQAKGMRADQVSQVRGYADQKLRKPDAPSDASNRRISVIVHYVEKATSVEVRGGSRSKKSSPGGNKPRSKAREKEH